MQGNVQTPVFINGPTDKVLVGDTVETTSVSKVTGDQNKTVAPEPEELELRLAPTKPEFVKVPSTTKTPSTPEEISLAVKDIPKGDQSAAIDLVKKLKKEKKLDLMDAETTKTLIEATGLDARMKTLSPKFDLDDISLDVQKDMLDNMDWSDALSLDSMAGMLDNMKGAFPSLDLGEFTDSIGLELLQDSSFKEALFGDAEWLDGEFFGKVGLGMWLDKPVEWLSDMMSDFVSDKQLEWVLEMIEELSPELLAAINGKMVNQILKVYPMGFGESWGHGGKTAYDKLTQKLNRIKPNWHMMERNGSEVANLEPYYEASEEALDILYLYEPHQTNVTLVRTYDLMGIDHLVKDGAPTDEALEVKPNIA